MSSVKSFFSFIGSGGKSLDKFIFARFCPGYTPASHPILLPGIGGIIAGIVLIFLGFSDCENEVTNPLTHCLLYMVTGMNVLLHMGRIFDMPTPKLKIGYWIFISVISYVTVALVSILTAWAVVGTLLICFVRILSTQSSPKPEVQEEGIHLSNGDVLRPNYDVDNTFVSKHSGRQYCKNSDNTFSPLD